MKLDSKLNHLLKNSYYEVIDKTKTNSLHYDSNIKYRYLSDGVIEFNLIANHFDNIIRYDYSTKEYSIVQKIDVAHPVCGSYTMPDYCDEMWAIFSFLWCLNTQSTISYVNDEGAGLLFFTNGDWQGAFDMENHDRISYNSGVYKYQTIPADEKGHVSSDSEIVSTEFNTYNELEAFLFQMESTEHFSESVGGVVNLLRDYHK